MPCWEVIGTYLPHGVKGAVGMSAKVLPHPGGAGSIINNKFTVPVVKYLVAQCWRLAYEVDVGQAAAIEECYISDGGDTVGDDHAG